MHLGVKAHCARGLETVANVEFLVLWRTLSQQRCCPCSGSHENLVSKQGSPILQLDTLALATSGKRQASHLANDIFDTVVDGQLDHSPESLVRFGEPHIGVVENLVNAVKVGGLEGAIPPSADLFHRKKLGAVGDSHVLVGGNALLSKIRGVGPEHADFVVPRAVCATCAPDGHGPVQHAHVQSVWVVVTNNLVHVMRGSSGVWEVGRVNEGDLDATLSGKAQSGGSSKVAGADNDDGRHGAARMVGCAVDRHGEKRLYGLR